MDQVADAEIILQEHRNLVYGIWDYIKNSGEYESENYDLNYVSPVPGKRESRRIMGDYLLTEHDLVYQTDFPDAVGHGGWPFDLHAIRGFFAHEPLNKYVPLKGVYQIPYRCGYSKDISNLFIEGRCMSTTHVANGSARVMATLSTIGQANGVAAYLCKKYSTTPRGIFEAHLDELQQILLRYDQYVIGKEYTEENNLARSAQVTVSSVRDLKIPDMADSLVLEYDSAVSIPVRDHLQAMRVLLNVKENTTLKYAAYAPPKKENYNPVVCLGERTLSVEKTNGFTWITLPLDVKTNGTGSVFFILRENENVEWAYSSEMLTGIVSAFLQPTDTETFRRHIPEKDEPMGCSDR